MEVTITYSNGEQKSADVKPGDMVAFERKYDLSWAEVSDKPRVEHSMFLAWNALRRNGLETRDFDTFLDDVADMDVEQEDGDSPLGS